MDQYRSSQRSSHMYPHRSLHDSPLRSHHHSSDRSLRDSPHKSPFRSPHRSLHNSPLRSHHHSSDQSVRDSPHKSPLRSPHQSPLRSLDSPHKSPLRSPHQSPQRSPLRSLDSPRKFPQRSLAHSYREFGSSSTYVPKLEEFKFFYDETLKEGMNIECKDNKTNIGEKLGTLTNKAFFGKPSDKELLLTFTKNGVETFHVLDNTKYKYRQY